MNDDADFPLHGRDTAVELVRAFLARRPTPVVIFTGPSRSGKSMLLKDLDRRAKGRVPHALVNCADFGAGRANCSRCSRSS